MAENVKEQEDISNSYESETNNMETTEENVKKPSSCYSEYDSAESYSDGNIKKVKSTNSENDSQDNSDSETEGSMIFEREEGDGQESVPSKKVDDDEDKKNPQYIPKRGTFYEHDDRTADDGEAHEGPDVEKSDKESKKKVWQDKKERWSHDRFNDVEQAPKSRSELIAIYGYDIRNEDGPPRARRRRRYGRGPNKYTRNWEDEDAYGKSTVIRKVTKKPKSKKQEHESSSDNKESNSVEEPIIREEERVVPTNVEFEEIITVPKPKENVTKSNFVANQNERQNYKNQRVGTGRVVKPKREIKDSDYSGFTKSRQYKNTEQKVPVKKDMSVNHSNANQSMQEIEKDMNKLTIQEGSHKNNGKHNNQRLGSVPPRLQGEQKGSKRYSSIRQRSLPETANPPFSQHGTYYGNDYNQQNQTSQQTQNMLPANTLTQMPPPALPPLTTQVPVTSTPILQGPPQFAPPFPPAPQFLQPGVAPAPYIPQQTAPIINYLQSQPQFPQAAFPGYQQQFNLVNQPTDLYQPQGGITYYSTQEQQAAQRAIPPKRPKVAIPIVAPSEHRGRGRSMNHTDPSPNATNLVTEIVNESIEKYEDATVTVAQ